MEHTKRCNYYLQLIDLIGQNPDYYLHTTCYLIEAIDRAALCDTGIDVWEYCHIFNKVNDSVKFFKDQLEAIRRREVES